MSDPTAAFDDDDTAARDDLELVETVAAEYFHACETAGGTVDLDPYLQRLRTEAQRNLLRQMVRAVGANLRGGEAPQVGMRLDGRYVLDGKIGQGGMGVVWSAHDERVDRKVAIKILHPLIASQLESQQLIVREVQLMQSIGHPGVAAVHDFHRPAEDGRGFTYFVMELVDGRTLEQVLADARKQGTRPDGRGLAQLIGRPVLDGHDAVLGNEDWYRSMARIVAATLRILEAAHARGVVHRDLKPSNIMLCAGGRPMLLDFGLGRSTHMATQDVTQSLAGSLHYLAPEQVSENRTGASPRADVYQIGAVFYECLTLSQAVDGDSLSSILANISKGSLRNPRDRDPHIPRELVDICLRAMEHNPARRYATARLFREDLERFLAGDELPLACHGSLARRVRYFGRRHSRALTLLAAVSLTAVSAWFMLPGAKLFELVKTVSVRPEQQSGDHEAIRAIASVKVAESCDTYALLFVERGGKEYVHVLYSDSRQRRQRLAPGQHVVSWSSDLIPVGGSWRVEMYASSKPGGFDTAWSHLASGHQQGLLVSMAEDVLDDLHTRVVRGETLDVSGAMILGDESLGTHGERVTLSKED